MLTVNFYASILALFYVGKGRCCMLAAIYLLHCGIFMHAEEAVAFVCRERTPLQRNALIVPSQIRYGNDTCIYSF